MHAGLRSLIVASFSLLLLGACARHAASQEKSDDSNDVIVIRNQDQLKRLSTGSENWIVVEATHKKSSQPMTTTATFKKGDVLYGQFIGTSPEPMADNPKMVTSNIKLITPKYKGKYKFFVSCHYEGEKIYNIHSKPLEIEIE